MKIQRIVLNQDLTIAIFNGLANVVICVAKEIVSNLYFVNTLFISSVVFVAAGVYFTIVSSSPCNCRIGVSLLTGELSAVIGSHFSKGNHAPNGMKPRKQV